MWQGRMAHLGGMRVPGRNLVGGDVGRWAGKVDIGYPDEPARPRGTDYFGSGLTTPHEPPAAVTLRKPWLGAVGSARPSREGTATTDGLMR